MITPSNPRDISWIGAHLNDADRTEILCQLPEDTLGSHAALSCHFATPEGLSFIAADRKGAPIAAFGAVPITYPVWQAWCFGTARMWRALPELSKFCSTTFKAKVIERGCRRLEVRTLKYHRTARSLLKALGAAYVCDLPDCGRNGETFELWAWTIGSINNGAWASIGSDMQDASGPALRGVAPAGE